LTHEGLHKLS